MARPLRLEFPGGLYHLTARGNERKAVFRDDADRTSFLATLAQVVARFGWRCLAYCLMGNHYHLLVEAPKPNLARGMRQLNGVYAQRFNRRLGRVGHVFQGRYSAIVIEREPHLLAVARYIVLNPVRARLCSHPAEWPWSSYRATVGLAPPPSFLACHDLLETLGASPAEAQDAFRAFTEDALEDNPFAKLDGTILLGRDEFVSERTAPLQPQPEIPRKHWQPLRPSLAELFHSHGEQAIVTAYREHGYQMHEIATHLQVDYATISRRLRALERQAMSQYKT